MSRDEFLMQDCPLTDDEVVDISITLFGDKKEVSDDFCISDLDLDED